jgi:rhodanese-related sulfurtransferase
MSMIKHVIRFIQWAVVSLLLGVAAAHGAVEKSTAVFPYRSQYDVNILETPEFAAKLNAVVVVDVRSKYEFDTLHVKGAVNIPLDNKDFIGNVRKLRSGDARPIVFYCNGKTCRKSYDAAATVVNAGILNVYAYDAGILAWAEVHPESTVLRGKALMKISDLISEQEFTSHVLAPKPFAALYEQLGNKAVSLDIRDRVQRDNPVFGLGEERIPLDDLVRMDALIEEAKKYHKTLLVYDKAGHQIRWFQYYLREKGLRDYHFLKGGSEGYFVETLGLKEFGKK